MASGTPLALDLRYLAERPNLLPDNADTFNAWLRCWKQRQVGMGESPIAMHDVESWMRMAAVPESERAALLAGILACEDGWAQGRAAAEKQGR